MYSTYTSNAYFHARHPSIEQSLLLSISFAVEFRREDRIGTGYIYNKSGMLHYITFHTTQFNPIQSNFLPSKHSWHGTRNSVRQSHVVLLYHGMIPRNAIHSTIRTVQSTNAPGSIECPPTLRTTKTKLLPTQNRNPNKLHYANPLRRSAEHQPCKSAHRTARQCARIRPAQRARKMANLHSFKTSCWEDLVRRELGRRRGGGV